MRYQYDTIGERFAESKSTAAFSAADTHTLLGALDALGGVRGLDTLDLACGYGYNTRLLARGGARRTVGVDISEEMIRLAREHEAAEEPAGSIEYLVADAAGLPDLGPFDLATAVYLFNYAPDRNSLHAMFRSARANLRAGGKLLAIVPNAGAFPRVDWSPFGVRILDRVQEGDAPLLKAHFLTEPPVPFEFREWAHADLAEAAVEAGFATVGWQPSRTPPADPVRDEAYWTAYRAWPVSSLMTCTA
ncbi:class I SAM-dependent methyltransferase [Streptomyces sp. ISL-94]|uniref:class I SAM-dependent methyltransferase n=1 Tax=Streptomyces sp. ISL-94 TaxID=2819190 RepID=UPI001BE87178|nr:class I SAM-dependent methyltransferase [Streptomyces sp. ISL-94]MBT2483036.1 class I SAM-dependent methyltransferase [Streptomyces sp. ISL-94]